MLDTTAVGSAGRTNVAVPDGHFQRFLGTTLFFLFAGSFFDQVMLPEVAAGVDWTGRVRNTPFQRAGRSIAGESLIFVAHDADTAAFSQWLHDAHRAVKGVHDGVRFSALNPETWNWIMASGALAYQNSYTPITGEHLTDTDRQRFYELILDKFAALQLPSKNAKLPTSYQELLDWYDGVLATKGQHTKALANAVHTLRQAPAPPGFPAIARPLWTVPARVAGHVAAVCSFGVMRPSAQALTGYRWTTRHQLEFRLVCAVLPVLYHRLPRRLTQTPLAYHRWRYDRTVMQYRSMQLDSFAPSTGGGGCPL